MADAEITLGTITVKVAVTMNDPEYRHVLAHVKRLVELDPLPDSPAGCALQILAFVVSEYESRRWPMKSIEPTGENMVG